MFFHRNSESDIPSTGTPQTYRYKTGLSVTFHVFTVLIKGSRRFESASSDLEPHALPLGVTAYVLCYLPFISACRTNLCPHSLILSPIPGHFIYHSLLLTHLSSCTCCPIRPLTTLLVSYALEGRRDTISFQLRGKSPDPFCLIWEKGESSDGHKEIPQNFISAEERMFFWTILLCFPGLFRV